MTPLEVLEAAIVRLETFSKYWAFAPDPTAIYETDEFGIENHVADAATTAYRDQIVLLSSTVAPILAILDHAAKRGAAKVSHGGKFDVVWSHERDTLALADAILGDTK